MKRSHILVLLVLVGLLTIAAFSTWSYMEGQRKAASDAGQLFTEEEASIYTNEAGETYTFSVADGSYKLVTVWATWVPEIAKHLAVVGTVASSFETSVEAIAVNRDEQLVRVDAYFRTREKPTNITFVQNPGDALYEKIEAYAMPETVLFNGDGEIVWRHRGLVTEAVLTDALNKELDI